MRLRRSPACSAIPDYSHGPPRKKRKKLKKSDWLHRKLYNWNDQLDVPRALRIVSTYLNGIRPDFMTFKRPLSSLIALEARWPREFSEEENGVKRWRFTRAKRTVNKRISFAPFGSPFFSLFFFFFFLSKKISYF